MTDVDDRIDDDDRERSEEIDTGTLIRALPILTRLAAAAWWRATSFTIEATVSAGVRIIRGAANGESPAELIQATEAELREYVRKLLGVMDTGDDDETPHHQPPAGQDAGADEDSGNGHVTSEVLRQRGEELLRRSADVDYSDDAHPAYMGIIDQLAPDEGRILRLLCEEGPQPAIDVRTGGPLGVVRSELVAPGINMIGTQAGCRYPERIHSYLNNLYRLGLIWFSREPLEDITRYQVLEAQPEVSKAMEEAGRAKTVRRSIHLTPFGADFCATVLPVDTGEIEALPGGNPDGS